MKKFNFYAKSCKLFFQKCGFTVFEKSLTLALIHTMNSLVEVIIENLNEKAHIR